LLFTWFLFVFSILTEAESLFVTNGASAFVLHNGERLISFASAAERDSVAASVNRVLWLPSNDFYLFLVLLSRKKI
jgi:hypothetical protein